MKTLKCDLCDFVAQGETFGEWMNALKPHYGTAHADIMMKNMQLPPEEMKTEMEKWMTENKARFEAV